MASFLLLRFNLQCEPEQFLSYSVTGFKLEGKSICSGQPQCLDWVQHRMKNVQDGEKLCGSGELGEIHADGANEMRVEFVSNRRSQNDGFEYYITCIDPGFDGNAVRSGAVADATPKEIREAAQCTSPSRERPSTTSQDNPLVGIHVLRDECLIHPIVL